jgi:enoyl-[acyl-carrier protein] reductase II
MLSAMVLGAEGVQMGSRFVASEEASSHPLFKAHVLNTKEGDTQLSLKKLTPVRLIKNQFFLEVEQAENNGATKEELEKILGRGRAKKGMFEGDLVEGELEIGQVSAIIHSIKPAADIVSDTWNEFKLAVEKSKQISF